MTWAPDYRSSFLLEWLDPFADKLRMSLINSISNLQAAQTASQVQYAVAAKALQTTRAQGEAAVQLIQSAAEGMNQALENVAKDLGSQIDVRA